MFLGVDSGGTKTAYILINSSGEIIATHYEPTSYYLEVGLETSERVICRGLEALCAKAKITPQQIRYSFFGLPAYGEDRQVTQLLNALPKRILNKRQYSCGNDMVCGWAGSLGGIDGINIVAGTGSIGYGEYKGTTARAGGWSEVIGDEGSGYWIASHGLSLFSRMADGRVKKGPLFDIMMNKLKLHEPLDLIGLIHGDWNSDRSKIATLSHYVSEAANVGDTAAMNIFLSGASELVKVVDAVRINLNWPEEKSIPVSYSGGVFETGELILKPLEENLSDTYSYYKLLPPTFSPVIGAALYAAKLVGVKVPTQSLP